MGSSALSAQSTGVTGRVVRPERHRRHNRIDAVWLRLLVSTNSALTSVLSPNSPEEASLGRAMRYASQLGGVAAFIRQKVGEFSLALEFDSLENCC